MHWAVIPLLVTAVSAAAVDNVETAVAGSERDGKCKKYISKVPTAYPVCFSVQHLSNCKI